MVVDPSALLAVLFKEPGAERIARSLEKDPRRLACALTFLQAAIVVEARKGEPGGRELDLLVHRLKLESIPLTESHAEVARDAWRRYGKGRHPANLNMSDCCSYALACVSGEPLLFLGDDFAKTDVRRVEY
jgi:ribonuclease VapC